MQFTKKERDFKGVWIPRHIYLNKDLSWTEKILLVEIHSLDNGDGCFAGDEHFALFLDKSEGTIANLISKLKKMGYLRLLKFDGRRRYLGVTDSFFNEKTGNENESSFHENVNPDFTKTLTLTSRKSEHNNTYNNTEEKQLEVAEKNEISIPQEDDVFSEKYALQFVPCTMADAKEKLTSYFVSHDISKETDGKVKQEDFTDILQSFITKRVEGEYKKQFKNFPTLHADFLNWAKRHKSHKAYSSKAEPEKEKIPHRTADQLDDKTIQTYIEKLELKNKITPPRIKHRITKFMAFVKDRADKLVVVQRLHGITEKDAVRIMLLYDFNEIVKGGRGTQLYDAIDAIPQREDLKQCESIVKVIATYLGIPT